MLPALRSSRFLNFGTDEASFSDQEREAVSRLSRAYRRLLQEDCRLDMKTEAGHRAVVAFLERLEAAAAILNLEPATRDYRSQFTVNYRALFPDETRNYRVDVLEASADQFAVIWVNGDKFEFSADAMTRAEALQCLWAELFDLLERWCSSASKEKPPKSEFMTKLKSLDHAWAAFEMKYITELMDIESKARSLIVEAIEHERALQQMEKHYNKGDIADRFPTYREEQRELVNCISRLNACANVRRKGRDDLGADILFDAIATLRRCDAFERCIKDSQKMSAARVLASDVVESFQAMRKYFKEVASCLERVDPHLCNNAGLVARLVDWEESWEVGSRYVQNEKLLDGVCDVVAQIRAAQDIVPSLTDMCEDCDVELFLVLPRIIWLRYLEEPELQVGLLRTMLPHLFADSTSKDESLSGFIDRYKNVKATLPYGTSWTTIVKRVVLGSGPSEKEEVYRGITPKVREAVEQPMEELMRDLESRSIELQRHCPEDWNQCSAILIQCLSSDNEKENSSPFGM